MSLFDAEPNHKIVPNDKSIFPSCGIRINNKITLAAERTRLESNNAARPNRSLLSEWPLKFNNS